MKTPFYAIYHSFSVAYGDAFRLVYIDKQTKSGNFNGYYIGDRLNLDETVNKIGRTQSICEPKLLYKTRDFVLITFYLRELEIMRAKHREEITRFIEKGYIDA